MKYSINSFFSKSCFHVTRFAVFLKTRYSEVFYGQGSGLALLLLPNNCSMLLVVNWSQIENIKNFSIDSMSYYFQCEFYFNSYLRLE